MNQYILWQLAHLSGNIVRSSQNPIFYCDFICWAVNHSEFVEIA